MFLYTFMIPCIREDFLSPRMWVFLHLLLRIFRQPHLVFFREEEACAFLKNGITFIVPSNYKSKSRSLQIFGKYSEVYIAKQKKKNTQIPVEKKLGTFSYISLYAFLCIYN